MYHRHACHGNQTVRGFHRDDPWLVSNQKVYRQGADLQQQPEAAGITKLPRAKPIPTAKHHKKATKRDRARTVTFPARARISSKTDALEVSPADRGRFRPLRRPLSALRGAS